MLFFSPLASRATECPKDKFVKRLALILIERDAREKMSLDCDFCMLDFENYMESVREFTDRNNWCEEEMKFQKNRLRSMSKRKFENKQNRRYLRPKYKAKRRELRRPSGFSLERLLLDLQIESTR